MNIKMGKIKKSITDIDFIVTGTILTRYKQCGKVNCRCMKDTKHLFKKPNRIYAVQRIIILQLKIKHYIQFLVLCFI